jgi:plasmid rolling circle replication initiator protein Rep
MTAEMAGDNLYLTEISPRDQPWDDHKAIADIIRDLYSSAKCDRYADRIKKCGKCLEFALRSDEEGTIGIRLQNAHFCRVRHCPVCQWRRSMKWQAKMFGSLPKIKEVYPTHRWLFLTLTVRNCEISELKTTINSMNKAFKRLTELKIFPAIGWVKSLEVTRNSETNQAHPHFHCLLLVPPSYFAKNYIKQETWVELWKQSLRVNYLPSVNIKTVKPKPNKTTGELDDIGGSISETFKYSIKEEDLIADKDWLIELTSQLHKTRAISIGGILKDFLKEEAEDDDLVKIGDEEEEKTEDEISIFFDWKEVIKRYAKKRTEEIK